MGVKAYGESLFLDNATILVISRVDAARASRLLKLKFQCLKCRGNFVPLPVFRSTIKAGLGSFHKIISDNKVNIGFIIYTGYNLCDKIETALSRIPQ